MHHSQSNFLTQIRAATAEGHKKLEELPMSKRIVSENIKLNDYSFYLSCMREVMLYYDTKLLPEIMHLLPDTINRCKYAAINSDLEWLKENGLQVKPALLFNFPGLINEPFAFGVAYVMEGSTLGGQFILKHIENKTAITKSRGGAFLNGYGAQTGKMWKVFLSHLSDYAIIHNAEDEIINGAQACFGAIYSYFLKCSDYNTET